MEKVMNYDSQTIKTIVGAGSVPQNSPSFQAIKKAEAVFAELGNLLASGNISPEAYAHTCALRDVVRAQASVKELITLGWNGSFGKGGTA